MCDFYRKRRDRCTLPNVSAVSAFFINSAKWLSTTVTVVESQFIAHDGATTTTEVADGTSVMRAAMNNRIGGIVAECGGSMMCATCHVYLRAPWAARLAPIDATEEAMLTMTVAERRPGSRLCCQIIVGAALDGLTVEVPDKQV